MPESTTDRCYQDDQDAGTTCDRVVAYTFDWPGRPTRGVCAEHVNTLRGVALSFHHKLELVPVTRQGEPEDYEPEEGVEEDTSLDGDSVLEEREE